MKPKRSKPRRKPKVVQGDQCPDRSRDMQAALALEFKELQDTANAAIRNLIRLGGWTGEVQGYASHKLSFARQSHKRRGKVVRGRTLVRMLKNELPAAFTRIRRLVILEATGIVRAAFDRHGYLIGWTVAQDVATWQQWKLAASCYITSPIVRRK